MREDIKFMSLDGICLDGVIEKPSGDIKGALLLLHGCPSYKDEYGFYSTTPNEILTEGGMAEFLSSNGYVSLRFDYRDQGENIKAEDMKDLTLSGMISDTESAFFELKKYIPKKVPIFVVGTSFAGGLSVKWIRSYNREVAHLFLMCPLLDMPYTLRIREVLKFDERGMEVLADKYKEELSKHGYIISGNRKVNSAFINEVMMMNIKEEFKLLSCSCTIYHGTVDDSVPYKHSVDFIENHNNGKSKLITIEGARHGFSVPLLPDGTKDQISKYRNRQFIFESMLSKMEEYII